MRVTEDSIYFYGSIYSQWYIGQPFIIKNISYNCAEQYMMAMKAEYFGDLETLVKIMATQKPWEQKALGRTVKNFNDAQWAAVAETFVVEGNMAKFTQDLKLQTELLASLGKELVEASPTDCIWGIGLAEDDDAVLDRKNWRGPNLLGKSIMTVRKRIYESLAGRPSADA